MLTIAGLVLAVWFFKTAMPAGPAPLPAFVVAAIAAAMISVGVRYILKSSQKGAKQKKPREGSGS